MCGTSRYGLRTYMGIDKKGHGSDRYDGFTLIELLVVISIIALLLSILMPSLKKARDLAKDVVCRNRLRQQGITIMTYTADNNGWFPEHNNIYPNYVADAFWFDPGAAMKSTDMPELLKNYVSDPWIWYCPLYARRYKIYNSPDFVDGEDRGGPTNQCGWNKRSLEFGFPRGSIFASITYQLMANWNWKTDGVSKYIKYYNGNRQIRRASDATSNNCLSSDMVNILKEPIDFKTLPKGAYGHTNIAHPYEIGGINVLYGAFNVERTRWRDLQVQVEYITEWPYPQYIYW